MQLTARRSLVPLALLALLTQPAWSRAPYTPEELAYFASPPPAIPEKLTLPESLKALKESKDPKKLIAAATAIANSSDAPAWQALRDFLASPEMVKTLEIPIESRTTMGASESSNYCPYLMLTLSAVARGTPAQANATFLWLIEQPPYNHSKPEEIWRSYVAYDALQFLSQPDEKILEMCKVKLTGPGDTPAECKAMLSSALAAWSTPQSLDLYKQYDGHSGSSPKYLLIHRDKPDTLKLFLEQYASDTTSGYLNAMLDDKLTRRGQMAITLPPWPTGPDALKCADVLETFRTSQPKIPLTYDKDQRLQDLIKKLRTAPPPPAPQ